MEESHLSLPAFPSVLTGQSLFLLSLPEEVLLRILSFLTISVSDLLHMSRTCRKFRRLANDPHLHQERFRDATFALDHALTLRPSRASLCPPNAWIYLSKTSVLSRSISKSLIRIRLSHNLEQRPSATQLIEKAILKSYSLYSAQEYNRQGLTSTAKTKTSYPITNSKGKAISVFTSTAGSPSFPTFSPVSAADATATSSAEPGSSTDSSSDSRKNHGHKSYFHLSPSLVQSQHAIAKRRLKDKLGRKLERRPSMDSLVSMNIIPEECARQRVSPNLVATRRRIMREEIKDGLRAWVQCQGVQAQKRKADEIEASERSTVKALVRLFAAKKVAHDKEMEVFSQKRSHGRNGHVTPCTNRGDSQDEGPKCQRTMVEDLRSEERTYMAGRKEKKRVQSQAQLQILWGRDVEIQSRKEERRSRWGGGTCLQPTRAHVLGLKRFWEGMIRTTATA